MTRIGMIVLYVYTYGLGEYVFDDGAHEYKKRGFSRGHFEQELRELLRRTEGRMLSVVIYGSGKHWDVARRLCPHAVQYDGMLHPKWFDRCLDMSYKRVRDGARYVTVLS